MTEEDTPLRTLATRYGIAASYRDTLGRSQQASDETIRAILGAIGIDAATDTAVTDALGAIAASPPVGIPVARAGRLDLAFPGATEWQVELEDGSVRGDRADGHLRITGLPVGLHNLTVTTERGPRTSPLPAPPAAAPSAKDLTGHSRHWGMAAPLYGLRGRLGPGTYRDLGMLAEGGGRIGASHVLINPVHALFPGAPSAFSPYSPSHRRFLNIAHIDVTAVPELADAPCARDLLQGADNADGELLDYRAFSEVHFPVLDALFTAFDALPAEHPRRQTFETWRHARGPTLERYAIYEALAEAYGPFWSGWPAGLRDVGGLELNDELADNTCKHAWFQWLAEAQLDDAQARARTAGMAFGLMLDLAVGVRVDGAEAWAEPDNFARGVSIGAPPDAFNPNGQNWALAPLNPSAMRTGGLRAFAETLRASMRHAGALRIDHVLGLRRNFWIADQTGEGAYITFPQEALFAVVAIEAHRNGCLVVGEDLGNVPGGFRDEMAANGIYGCRLLYFQRKASGAFVDPAEYEPATMASIGSHDLATLGEWWDETDLHEMEAIGVLTGGDLVAARDQRARDRRSLCALLGLDKNPDPETLHAEVHARLGQSGSDLATLQLEIALPDGARLNLPGTTSEYPNWRRRLPATPTILGSKRMMRLAANIRQTRAS